MNAVVTDDADVPVVIDGPGKRLKSIRESKGLDLASVASMLHLNVSKLESLEEDDYENLPGAVFIQGYLRNYARLLEIPSGPVLEAYSKLNPGRESMPDLKVNHLRKEVHSSHGLVRMITWVIVLGLFGLVLTWWQGYLQWPLKSDQMVEEETVPAYPEEDKPLGDLPMGRESALPTFDSGQASLQLPVAQPDDQITDEQTITIEDEVPAEEAGADQTTLTELPPLTDNPADLQEGRLATTSETAPVAVEQDSPAATKSVELVFSGDCWVNVRDSVGSFKLAGTQPSGKRQVLGGTPPYKMVLGNASAVTVLVNGSSFDLTPYTSGNVAKFTLELD
ncbi:MAG: hypothetical protein C0631_06675 [Sedimenticola sp.]|jgi:cytoskeleton protein RodZ|nr:MAG: hypothetical protein C0631_06675 [Sedimenticola sp.]